MGLRWNKQLLLDYRNTFNSPEGKRVLADLKKRCPLLSGPLGIAKGVDVNMMLVMEGQSNIVKHIYTMLNRDPNEESPERAVNEVKIEGI